MSFVESGCSWSQWMSWSECSASCNGGMRRRHREKLPTLTGSCEGSAEESGICNEGRCPLYSDKESKMIMIGGGVDAKTNISPQISILTKKNLCRRARVPELPFSRSFMSAVYDHQDHTIIACGGLESGPASSSLMKDSDRGTAKGECVKLAKDDAGQYTWTQINPMPTPVYGAASVYHNGKVYVFGGDPGVDNPMPSTNLVRADKILMMLCRRILTIY